MLQVCRFNRNNNTMLSLLIPKLHVVTRFVQINIICVSGRRKPKPPKTNYSKKILVPYLPPTRKELNEALDNCNGIRDITMLQNGQY